MRISMDYANPTSNVVSKSGVILTESVRRRMNRLLDT
eukprot:CAMPEP_0118917188 /NCGR_PEP_ID=MMETSP1166-20130328/17102_1 /TAXON_ID=1104430 /ORGANISM="Chrysoreinhardia sp, Strain CCMP3193" /LENGTH=36 /DNA_ID= /DNA_START= /DNA_END= /DNA_ORIENTATION=